MNHRTSVAILQYRLFHYRVQLFELMRAELKASGVDLIVIHGQPSESEKLRKDAGNLSWAVRVENRFWKFAGKDMVWQPLPPVARNASLLVTIQENRILSNYVHQIRRSFGGPMVGFWGHGRNFQSTRSSGIRERWKRLWLKKVDWWFAYTELSTQLVREAGYPAEHITTLNNAIDVTAFQRQMLDVDRQEVEDARERCGIGEDAMIGLFCGSLYAEKRIDLLLSTADYVRARIPTFHLVVVGDGPSAADVREAARTRPWLHVLGVRMGQDKAVYFKMAHVQLNPGAVGLHVLDAFAAGLPMITTSTALHGPEIAYLEHGVNGWICKTDNASEYAEAVLRVLRDDDVRLTMASCCLESAKAYTIEKMAKRFVDGILGCLRSRVGPA